MSNNEGDVSENVTVKKSRFFQLCHGYFNSLKTSNCIGFIPLELNFWDQARGVLDIFLGGEVRRGPSYPDPV